MTHTINHTHSHGQVPAWTDNFDKQVSRLYRHWAFVISNHLRSAIEVDTSNSRAIRQLSAMTDSELSDIGLGRSDLTPEGLNHAAERRARKQAMI